MNLTKKLENKVAIVTGGASGIGEATARSFAEHGARAVVIADVQEEKGQRVAESISLHCNCTFAKCDVSDEEQVKNLVDSTVNKYGRLDIMFSNAGITSKSKQDVLDFDFSEYESLFAINVRGMIACVKHAGRAMASAANSRGVKGSSIICAGSVVAEKGAAYPIDYVMSKHAVLGLVRCASKGLGKHGIRVNCVSPAAVATPMTCKVMQMSAEDVEKHFEMFSTLKEIGALKVQNVADTVVFLASEESKFITGQNFMVDAGYNPF